MSTKRAEITDPILREWGMRVDEEADLLRRMEVDCRCGGNTDCTRLAPSQSCPCECHRTMPR